MIFRKRMITPRNLLFTIAAIVAVILALMVFFMNRKTTFRPAEYVFAIPSQNKISQFVIYDQRDTLFITKDADGAWILNNELSADDILVQDLLGILRQLTVRSPVSLNRQSAVNEQLDKHGIRVDLYEDTYWVNISKSVRLFPRNKRFRSIVVGDMAPEGNSNYMRMAGAELPFEVYIPGYSGNLLPVFSAKPEDWLNPVVVDLAYDQIRRIELTVTGQADESFVLQNDMVLGYRLVNQAGIQIEADKLNTVAIELYLSSFEGLFYEELVGENQVQMKEQTMFDQAFMEMVVVGTKGDPIHLRFYQRKLAENAGYLLPENIDADPNRFFLVVNDTYTTIAQYMIFNRILRPLSFFLSANQDD
jgi:hypothetical protein